MLLSLEIN
ncbi:UNVERIFIED_CONTAM: hypothetical protein GTU68_011000 [Idotea baltica]|nr:hypothetical protein [Idotea baltica]